MTRSLRIVGSFVVVVAAYCLYSLAVVPFVEPEATLAEQEQVSPEEREQAIGNVATQRTDLRRWFKEGDWELTSPKILETPQGKLLLKEYRSNPLDAHEITLKPCTMIFLPEGQFDDEEERQRRAIVLRSPEGATMRFAEPIDLKRGQIGSKIVGGKLLGKVTIHSDQRSPGPEDDLLLITEQVTLVDDVITTPHPVEFFHGPNQGRGREMRLELTTAAEKAAQPALSAAKTFELARDVYMRMEASDADVFPGGDKAGPREPAGHTEPQASSGAASGPPKPPVEITCLGPFKFDMRRHIATFHDRVDVVRLNAVGPSDTLACDRLALHFETDPTAAPAAAAGGKSAMPKLRPKLIVADGNPVKLDSRSNGVEARGRRLEYDVQTRSGKLLDGEEAVLRQNDPATRQIREIHARELEFESDPDSPSGPPRKVDARGKGWLRGTPPSDPKQKLYVSWTSRMTFQPYQGSQVLSIRGKAHVESSDSGQMDADEIHVWLQKAASATSATARGGGPGEGGFVPEKIMARGHVEVKSPQMTAVVREMDVWFAQEEPPPVAAAAAAPAAAAPPPPKPAERAPPSQCWHVSGDLLKVQALQRAGQTDVTELTLDGDARCAERPSAARSRSPLPEKPEQLLVITGEQFHLLQPTPDNATVRITGRPAQAAARGMTLTGGSEKTTGSIHLHRASNRLWIPGEGTLSLPVEDDMQGRKLAQPQLLTVVWQGRMDFDGMNAHFQKTAPAQKDVVAATEGSTLKTPDLQVAFSEPIRFAGDGGGPRPQVRRIFCPQKVDLEHRDQPKGRWVSWERMDAQNLTYDYSSGDTEAAGPGSITRTWLDDGSSSAAPPAGPSKKPPVSPAKPRERLLYLKATFEKKLTGNQRRETVTLHRHVSAVYGPVPHWKSVIDARYRQRLGTEGFVLNCDQLHVDKVGTTRDNQAAMELLGDGNTLIVGADFNARCRNVHYSSSKDLLVLSGDGRAPATFYRHQSSGATPLEFSGNRILYEPKRQHLKVDNFESLDVLGLQSKKPSAEGATK